MDNSFFGFDTSFPLNDDGGGQITEPSEEEYDALNDETFGGAINADWEEVHENLVRLTGDDCADVLDNGGNAASTSADDRSCALITDSKHLMNSHHEEKDALEDSDLELNLAGMKMDDVDFKYDESESAYLEGTVVNLDPSVWALQPNKEQLPAAPRTHLNNFNTRFPQQPQQQQSLLPTPVSPIHLPRPNTLLQRPLASNICTLEDIERSLIMQQTNAKAAQQQLKQSTPDVNQTRNTENDLGDTSNAPTLQPQPQPPSQTQTPPQLRYPIQPPQQCPPKLPPGFIPPHMKGAMEAGNMAQTSPMRPPNNFNNQLARPPYGNMMQHPPAHLQHPQHPAHPAHLNSPVNRLPPGLPFHAQGSHLPPPPPHHLPPHPLLNHHGIPNHYPIPPQRTMPHPHLPVALNNFAMHPNFNAIRAAATPGAVHPANLLASQQQHQAGRMLNYHQPSNAMPLLNNQNQSNTNYNMFNMRLVQEIQQNHPLLQNNMRQMLPPQLQQSNLNKPNMCVQNHISNSSLHPNQRSNFNMPREGMPLNNNNSNNNPNANFINQTLPANNGNVTLPQEEYDEYANLMSTRDKHWLIGIQLSQLNTDTPYIDDYYYTIYRERKLAKSGSLQISQAHKDNQLNHPLTQPKGHAQLVLVQLGNKNGLRNGHQGDNRNHFNNQHNNSSGSDLKLPSYVFNPLKFENSLGKLQCVSVTAPRKIIDADIMHTDENTRGDKEKLTQHNADANGLADEGQTTAIDLVQGDLTSMNTQRKCRQILLHIEGLYRILLKLEDLDNPNTVAAILTKKKKESERIAALEQLEAANKASEERVTTDTASNPALKSKFNYELETKEALIAKLLAGLKQDKVLAMMNVRKGKILLRRIMSYIEEHEMRWQVWMGIFNALQMVLKKDRDDSEGILSSLYIEFKKNIQTARFDIVVKLAAALALNDRKAHGIVCSKFGVLVLVCLILQAERIYIEQKDPTLNKDNKQKWRQFLHHVASSINRNMKENHSICATIDASSVQPIMNHFARFDNMKLDSLVNLIKQTKQHIN